MEKKGRQRNLTFKCFLIKPDTDIEVESTHRLHTACITCCWRARAAQWRHTGREIQVGPLVHSLTHPVLAAAEADQTCWAGSSTGSHLHT